MHGVSTSTAVTTSCRISSSHDGFPFLLDPEDGSDISLRNVGYSSTGYMALHHIRLLQCCQQLDNELAIMRKEAIGGGGWARRPLAPDHGRWWVAGQTEAYPSAALSTTWARPHITLSPCTSRSLLSGTCTSAAGVWKRSGTMCSAGGTRCLHLQGRRRIRSAETVSANRTIDSRILRMTWDPSITCMTR
jgi:hypothetical protein